MSTSHKNHEPRDPSERQIRRTFLNEALLPPPVAIQREQSPEETRLQTLDPTVAELRFLAFVKYARSTLGYTRCKTAADVDAVRRARNAEAKKRRLRIRQLDHRRAAIEQTDEANKLTEQIVDLRRALREVSSDSQIGRNKGDGGAPPSAATDAYQLFMTIADMLGVPVSKVVRATYSHPNFVPDERFIQRELNALRVWKHGEQKRRRALAAVTLKAVS